MTTASGLVLFGDVVRSRRDAAAASAWLRGLVGELDTLYDGQCIAPFDFTQGDELQGLLAPDADPFAAILHASLRVPSRQMRWAVVRGEIDAGEGPATQRTGAAFLQARDRIASARQAHEGLVVVTGTPAADRLLADLAPVLVDLLDDLTDRQREVARLALLEGLRQSEVADRLAVRRATISISFGRAGIRSLQRLLSAIRSVYREAVGGVAPPPRDGGSTKR